MVSVEVSTEIDRSVHDVFLYVENEGNMPRWDADLITATKTSEGPTAVGTTIHLDIKPFMGATEGSGRVIGYEPDEKVELQFDMGRMKPHVWHLFEPSPSGTGTRFTRRVEIDPAGLMKLMAPMMRSMIRKRNVQYLSKLKELLESGL
jgi:uncharacterized protein YndB with AHSA1/START domain